MVSGRCQRRSASGDHVPAQKLGDGDLSHICTGSVVPSRADGEVSRYEFR